MLGFEMHIIRCAGFTLRFRQFIFGEFNSCISSLFLTLLSGVKNVYLTVLLDSCNEYLCCDTSCRKNKMSDNTMTRTSCDLRVPCMREADPSNLRVGKKINKALVPTNRKNFDLHVTQHFHFQNYL